ncbi:hypothetical protein J2X97_001546 [Epilithonimonas hungarica]|uniref:hypothetical protein n=1 Tax=Epilithonimonas hungarica TaxID=454006 RepID=UPI00278288B6|nr:hypothetical protein [Epilithonimonas hungarica]MDP9955909.1 hypothetical protein [Epilithonimonas hungarica]
MINFVLIAVCIVAGMIFKSTKTIHPDAHKGINTWIIYLALPAVSFKYLPKVQMVCGNALPDSEYSFNNYRMLDLYARL